MNAKNTALIIGGLAVLGIGTAYIYQKGKSVVNDMRIQLINWIRQNSVDENERNEIEQIFLSMEDGEIIISHEYIFNYFLLQIEVPVGSDLYKEINRISQKYDNVFNL